MEPNTPDLEIADAFNRALAFATDLRAQREQASSDPFAYARLLETSLAPYDEACLRFHTEADVPEGRTEPTAAEAAWLRVSHALEPLLNERDEGPRLLTDQTLLVDRDGGMLREEQPAITDGPAAAGGAQDCCITSLELTNVWGKRVRLTLSHENGVRRRHIFGAGEKRTVTFRENAGPDEDEDDAKTKGPPIPGGMGHCVTVRVEEIVDGTWVEFLNKTICCDDDPPPREGGTINLERSLGGAPEHYSREPVFRYGHVEIARPCPNLPPAPPTPGQNGTAGSQSFKYEGTLRGRDSYFYGAGCFLVYRPNSCRNFCFVQGVKRRVWIGGRESIGLGTQGPDFKLDVRGGDRTPCYPFVGQTESGAKVLRDLPGVSDPWAPVKIDGQPPLRLNPGTELKIQWTFRTWIVCLDGDPVVLGHFDWSMTVIVTVGRDARHTTSNITPPQPVWSDDPDKDGYNKVAGQAPEHAGFIAK